MSWFDGAKKVAKAGKKAKGSTDKVVDTWSDFLVDTAKQASRDLKGDSPWTDGWL